MSQWQTFLVPKIKFKSFYSWRTVICFFMRFSNLRAKAKCWRRCFLRPWFCTKSTTKCKCKSSNILSRIQSSCDVAVVENSMPKIKFKKYFFPQQLNYRKRWLCSSTSAELDKVYSRSHLEALSVRSSDHHPAPNATRLDLCLADKVKPKRNTEP